MILKMVSYEFENDYINIINVCSRTLRQFDQNQDRQNSYNLKSQRQGGLYLTPVYTSKEE